MNLQIWKFFTTQILIIFRAVFSSPVILTFLATIISIFVIVFSGSNTELPNWMPSNFSVNEGDLLQWWGYGVIILSLLTNIFRKLFGNNYAIGFLNRFGLYSTVFSFTYILFIITLVNKGLIVGNSIIFYILWYILMIVFLLISLFITILIEKIKLLQNKKPTHY
jgi:hypothetical protein